jgi:hypothetical protein
MSQNNLSPEFDAFSREALDFCLEHGAAKLAGVFDSVDVTKLSPTFPQHPELLSYRLPGLYDFYALLLLNRGDLNDTRKIRVSSVTITPFTPDERIKPMSHIDMNAPRGVSLLVPVSGDEAFFGAKNSRFNDEIKPDYLTVYGLGDAILLRQRVSDERGVSYPQAHHLGISAQTRQIIAVDVPFVENLGWTTE